MREVWPHTSSLHGGLLKYPIFRDVSEIKRMRKQCVPGVLSLLPSERLGTRLVSLNGQRYSHLYLEVKSFLLTSRNGQTDRQMDGYTCITITLRGSIMMGTSTIPNIHVHLWPPTMGACAEGTYV